MTERTTFVDFVAAGDTRDAWRMVLVEEGPWAGSTDGQLRRVQRRMYGCIDAALDGLLAERFPESKGCLVVVRLDCFDVPRAEVDAFFQRFSSGVFSLDGYRQALEKNAFVRGIEFEISFDGLRWTGPRANALRVECDGGKLR
jgi:hypothetical protein